MTTPLLITLTAPSAAGKSYLFEKLMKQGFEHLVSTTTRAKRDGEVEGQDYYFISKPKSISIERYNGFAELVEFNGTRYGITNDEFEKKLASEKPIVAIMTPEGVTIYKKLMKEHDGKILTVFVDTPEDVRFDRLNERLYNQLTDNTVANKKQITAAIKSHTDRITKVVTEEREWPKMLKYDLTVPGDDAREAVKKIQTAIEKMS